MMRRFLMASLAVVLLLGTQGISNAVSIDGIDFRGCIPEVCQTPINVDATDPAGGNLTYTWEVLNGDSSLLSGSGADVVFDPPDSGPHPCPYRIAVSVTSDASDLSAYQTIEICVKLAGDVNGDCIVNLSDLNEIRDHFMAHGDPGWIDADLNCDGWVNLSDLNLVRDNFMASSSCTDSYFFDNFECGTGKWTLSGQDWDLYEVSTHGGKWSLTDSPDGNYPNYADEVVKNKYSIDLSSATFPVLTFWGKCAMDTSYYSDDYIYVDVSDDGGFTWETVWQAHDLNQNTWKQETIDLSPYISAFFKMRFRFVSDETGTADGWSIDDVEIREIDAIPPPTYPFFDDFESGVENWIISGQDWALTQDSYVSPTHSLTDSPDGSYPNYSHAVVESAGLMDLSSSTFPVLKFWGKCAMDTSYYSDDYIYVDVSDDGGLTWVNIWYKHDHNQSTWKQEGPIDLRPWISAQFKIRFRMFSDETGISDGWSIDDVEIAEFE